MKILILILIILAVLSVIYFSMRKNQNSNTINPHTKSNLKSIDEIFNITDPQDFANELGFYYASRETEQGFVSLNKEQKIVAVIWNLEAEVYNGGFDQYYFNPAGDHAVFTEEALAAIGSTKVLGLLKEANAVFPENSPNSDREIRWKQMDQWDDLIEDKLDKLTDEFYKCEEDIDTLQYQFCQKNRDKFWI
jgi:hypothetical protein